jgi:hypothetical protein
MPTYAMAGLLCAALPALLLCRALGYHVRVTSRFISSIRPSTSDEAPGLLAYGEHHLGAHHSPDVFHGQYELSKAVSAPMAAQQRAACKPVAQAEETLNRVHAHLDNASSKPAKRGLGRPPKVAASLEQVEQDVAADRQEHQHLAGQRDTVTQSIRAIGHAYHFVDLPGARRASQRQAHCRG